jgi:anti-anti-sigma factor
MLFTIQHDDNVHIIRLSEVTFSPGQISELQKQVGELTAQGNVNFVADMSQLKLLNSVVSSMLVVCLKQVRSKGGDLILAGMNESTRRQLDTTQLTSLFTITASVDEAKKKFLQKTKSFPV